MSSSTSLSSNGSGSMLQETKVRYPPPYVRVRSRSTPHAYRHLQHRYSNHGQAFDQEVEQIVRILSATNRFVAIFLGHLKRQRVDCLWANSHLFFCVTDVLYEEKQAAQYILSSAGVDGHVSLSSVYVYY